MAGAVPLAPRNKNNKTREGSCGCPAGKEEINEERRGYQYDNY